MDNLYLPFDIMCIIISLMIILPVIIKPIRINISKILIICVSLSLICIGIGSIMYQHVKTNDKITLEKEYRRYIYFGTMMLSTGLCSLIYIWLLSSKKSKIK